MSTFTTSYLAWVKHATDLDRAIAHLSDYIRQCSRLGENVDPEQAELDILTEERHRCNEHINALIKGIRQ